ncbi:MAG: hypothetical protein KAS53_03625 [Candidatus Cloacimonetes bacterium]|nr:hypothetical protein [Candidatus Cloacimonadota bacterium]
MNNKEFDNAIYKILQLKGKSLLEVRSRIVTELLNIRVEKVIKSLNLLDQKLKLPEEYEDLFFQQLFIVNEKIIQIPLLYKYLAAQELIKIDDTKEFDEAGLHEIYKQRNISEKTINKEILSHVYDNETDIDLDEYKKDKDMNGIITKEDKMLFYPFIVINDEFVESYNKLLRNYYLFFNNEDLEDSDKLVHYEHNLKPENRLRQLNLQRISHPKADLENNKLHYPIFEEIMKLEIDLIVLYIRHYNYIRMKRLKLNKNFLATMLIAPSLDYDIKDKIHSIEVVVQKFKAKILEQKAMQAEDKGNAIQGLNVILQIENKEINQKLKDANNAKGKETNPNVMKNKLMKIGEGWEVTFNGERKILKNLKGVFYIAICLELPNRHFKYTELMEIDEMIYKSENIPIKADFLSNREYLLKLNKKRSQIVNVFDENPTHNNYELDKIEVQIKKEKDKIKGLLLKGGIEKRASDKVAKSFSKNYKTAIDNIQMKSPKFYEHLNSYIKRGSGLIRYVGDLDWVVDMARKDN